jgi:hypothetical protein
MSTERKIISSFFTLAVPSNKKKKKKNRNKPSVRVYTCLCVRACAVKKEAGNFLRFKNKKSMLLLLLLEHFCSYIALSGPAAAAIDKRLREKSNSAEVIS